ncbi:sulfite dehydrogenase [Chitinophaga silvatica]|uniref:Sulfite dehydrogenase n=1 Tax=Chitinophaga silvatica TaxID=2282649 RepID=A0A3E1Y3E3_9BACT|nr:sulfite dehydrogenase [Chitinophaga silvatica]RFS19174.1 sulfite dehydrogenase [Chitinophaga silvatica]
MDQEKKLPRRAMIKAAAISATAAFVGKVNLPATEQPTNDDPTKIQGTPPGKVGTRSPFEQPSKKASDISGRTPLQDLYGIITPSDLHFERSHAGVPAINPDKYELLIHGMVERPMIFKLKDLKRFPAISRIAFIECSGNFRSGKETMTPQEICGLTSQSEWTGVMLSTLFREVGVSPKATWFLAEGSDAAVMTRSIPVEKGWKDAMIAYGQNGEAIRPEQGYPARLFLPGWEGNMNVKWIRRIELSDQPFMTREETSKYTETIKDHKIRQFSFDMDARSIITYPSYPQEVEKGWIEIRGIAWSGRGKIERVEISTDGGKHWQYARLQEPVLDKAHTYFRYLWHWDGSPTEIMSRAVDDTGYYQPFLKQLIDARGAEMGGYHLNPVTSWLIERGGRVLFKPEKWK